MEKLDQATTEFYQLVDKYQYILFHIAVLIILAIYYNEIQALLPTSASFPRLMLGITAFMWAVIAADILVPDDFKERLGAKVKETNELIDEDKKLEVHAPRSTRAFIWILVYWIAMTSIGFFTAMFAFIFIYALIRIDSSWIKRVGIALVSTIALTALMYVFLIDLVSARYLFQLGFLP